MNKCKSHKWTDEQLIEATKTSYSIAEILRKLNLNIGGANYTTIPKRIQELKLDTSHWLGHAHLKGKTHNWNPTVPLEQVLVVNRYTSSTRLRKRLIRAKILEEKCSICNLTSWQNKPLTLQLDHINGCKTDNRLENLRLLCPNCHSQTDTFAGRNFGNKNRPNYDLTPRLKLENLNPYQRRKSTNKTKYSCNSCGKKIPTNCARCQTCFKKTLIKAPELTKEVLEKLVWEKSTVQLAKQFGLSDKAIEKRCKKFGIAKPHRGYWAKQQAVAESKNQ